MSKVVEDIILGAKEATQHITEKVEQATDTVIHKFIPWEVRRGPSVSCNCLQLQLHCRRAPPHAAAANLRLISARLQTSRTAGDLTNLGPAKDEVCMTPRCMWCNGAQAC
jgi:hypothetical protein